MAFIAGTYTITWGPTLQTQYAVGITEEGFNLQTTFAGEPIKGDNLGDTIQDIVYRGGDCFLDFIVSEYSSAAITTRLAASPGEKPLIWPFGSFPSTGPNGLGTIGQVGRLLTSISSVLILTRVTGTATDAIDGKQAPDKVVAEKAILAPNTPLSLLLSTRHRKVPMRMQLLPFSYTESAVTDTVWFYTAAV